MDGDRFELTYIGTGTIVWDTLEYRIVYEGKGVTGQVNGSQIVGMMNRHWREHPKRHPRGRAFA